MTLRSTSSPVASSVQGLLLACLLALSLPYGAWSQEGSGAGELDSIRVDRFSLDPENPITLSASARAGSYLGVVGPGAAWLGFETGEGEVWVHPLKVAREISLSFKLPQYSAPISGADVARWVEVRPEVQTITYSHASFQVRQHVLAPRDPEGILLLLEVDAVVDMEIHVSFQPVMQYAWPGGMGGQYLYWDAASGAFVLSESRGKINALLGSPWATEASAHPAHRLAEAPSIFIIPVDRERARREFIPVVITGGVASREEVRKQYRFLLQNARSIYRENQRWAREIREQRLRMRVMAPTYGAPGDEGGALGPQCGAQPAPKPRRLIIQAPKGVALAHEDPLRGAYAPQPALDDRQGPARGDQPLTMAARY